MVSTQLDITNKKYYTQHITVRFLKAMGVIMGNRSNGKTTAKDFGEIVKINSTNLTRLRSSTGEHSVTVEAIGRMCNYYKISPYWLITGEGSMYADDQIINAYTNLESRVVALEDSVNQIEAEIGSKNRVNKKVNKK